MMTTETLMRRTLLLLPIALAASLLLGCGRNTGSASAEFELPQGGSGVAFTNLSFDEALGKARSGKTLLMVDVYTDWCGWCKKLDRDVLADERIGSATKGLVAIRLDAEKEGEKVAERFRIEGFPTVLFLDPSGEIVSRVNGYVTRDRMLELIAALPRNRT
jgi:thiol:disulfide interchange protein